MQNIVQAGVTVAFLGRLRDLKLGNHENGIPSRLANVSEGQLHDHAQAIADAVVVVPTPKLCGCIDGRECLHNGDGSPAIERRGVVGGSGSGFETALNGGVLAADETYETEEDFWTAVDGADTRAFPLVATHTGGCGGVNGAKQDNEAIADNEAIMQAVQAIASLPEVQEHTSVTFSALAADRIRGRAAKTAELLQPFWTGDKYVTRAGKKNPAGLQVLAVDESSPFKGHAEPSVVIVLSRTGNKTVSKAIMAATGHGRPFVWNIDASWDMAQRLNPDAPAEVFLANVAKHVAVCDRLPDAATPVFFVVID